MRKNAFTLIELLAVIVILAIIALIAVPIVLSIIEDSKKSSQEESIKMYGKAIEDAVANYLLINPNDKDITLAKIEKYINYSGERVECTDTKIYPNGKIYLGKCSVGGTEVTYTYGEKEKTLCTLVKKNGNEDINPGDEYTCEVIKGMEEPYTFYVLGTEGTGKNQKVNLIMDRNICNDGSITYTSTNSYCRYAWESNKVNGNGPITALTALGNGTRNWNNVPNMNLDYDDIEDNTSSGYTGTTSKGYKGMTITDGVGYITKKDGTQTPITLTDDMPIKARLPKLKEITEAGCHIYNSSPSSQDYGTCPVWLMGYMAYINVSSYTGSGNTDKYSMNNNNEAYQDQIYGYWLLSSTPGYSDYARYVTHGGFVGDYYANYTGGNGVRAVITVSKSNLSS